MLHFISMSAPFLTLLSIHIASGGSFTPEPAIKREREQALVPTSDNGLLMSLWFNKASKQHSLIHCQKNSFL